MDVGLVDAVMLDMDGKLVDSDAAVERAWTVRANEYGVEPAVAIAIAHGSPAESTVGHLLPELDAEAIAVSAARQLELQYDDLIDVTASTGAHELLAVLARLGIPWAVVTSADARLAKARLGAAGITAPLLVTFEDVTAGKPDPQGYLLAAEALGGRPRALPGGGGRRTRTGRGAGRRRDDRRAQGPGRRPPPRLSGPAGTSAGRHRSMMPVTRAASRAPLPNPALPNPGGLT